MGAHTFDSIHNAEINADGLVELPILPLNGMVFYPEVIAPVVIPKGRSIAAVRAALKKNQTVIGVLQKEETDHDPLPENLYTFGTEIALGRLHDLPNGSSSALAEGRRRAKILEIIQTDPYIIAKAQIVTDSLEDLQRIEIHKQELITLYEHIIQANDTAPDEMMSYIFSVDDPSWLADFIAFTMNVSLEKRQQILETQSLNKRLFLVSNILHEELDRLEIQGEIDEKVFEEFASTQREIYLREQLRIIQDELGEEDIFQQDLVEIRKKIAEAKLPAPVYENAIKELNRLQVISPIAPEVGIIHTYLDWLVTLPWSKTSEDNLDIRHAQMVLDREHHGLPLVKERILEHIAVRKLAGDKMKTPILCFVGPPGVGKTSLGKSIATALGREFVRVSLGGIRDEAEIRGHRRTYIGAMPGRILQTMQRAGTINPLFMLDEIDKIGADFRGDPSAALLEALDPEQNREFSDHYLDIPYDLSKVLFITTANDLYPLPPALLDRMEVIEFPGYTEQDKLEIARSFLIPRQLEAHGLDDAGLKFETSALQTIVRDYTYEAGVRNFNREIGKALRKIARLKAEDKPHPKRITVKRIQDYLGPPEYIALRANDEDSIGVATGLAWTSGGGDILTIEVTLLPGKGTMLLTGQLGDVMQESAQAALSYMRWRANDFDVPSDDFENYDVHVHLPEGSIPKDGPSAGITLAASIISVFTERAIRSDIAMTGEITLRGRVLPVGGIKEKVLAAHRNRIKNVILPEQNRKDLVEIPAQALRELNITFVEDMQQVIDLVLLPPPEEGRERDKYKDEAETENDS